MTYQRNISVVLLAGITLLLASCVDLTIRGGEAEGDVTAWPPAKSQKHRSISIVITCKPDNHLILVEPCDQNYKETFTNIYKESGLFFHVAYNSRDTDLRANIIIMSKGVELTAARKSWMAASLLTMFWIPVWWQDTFVVNTTFSKADGQIISTLEKKESTVTVIQLHLDLFIAMPRCVFFRTCPGDYDYVEDILSDITKATLLEAQKQHIL